MVYLLLINCIVGTGKTVTGAHLAYVLTKKLRQERSSSTSTRLSSGSVNIEELKPCVMYCGPSNQAVNVVLGEWAIGVYIYIMLVSILSRYL